MDKRELHVEKECSRMYLKFSTALKQPPLINPFYYLDLILS